MALTRSVLTWLLRGGLALLAVYVTFGAVVLTAMLQTPARFGQFMKYAPAPLVWGLLPAPRMWLWARGGHLEVGDPAPDFTLPSLDHKSSVTLSTLTREKPVVLVFGSYT